MLDYGKVKLNNGIEMPILVYGVYQVTPEEVVNAAYQMQSVWVIVLLIQL